MIELISSVNKQLEPDKIAKALGARSLVRGIMTTVTYRQLRNKNAIYMFRFGFDNNKNANDHQQTKIQLESLFDNDNDNNQSKNNVFGSADTTSISPLQYEHISTLSYDPVRGAQLPNVPRTHIKKYLKYRFVENGMGCFNVIGLYKDTTIIDSFSLKMSQMTKLLDLQTRLYTPDNSNTTFVLPKLVAFVGELQMRSVLM